MNAIEGNLSGRESLVLMFAERLDTLSREAEELAEMERHFWSAPAAQRSEDERERLLGIRTANQAEMAMVEDLIIEAEASNSSEAAIQLSLASSYISYLCQNVEESEDRDLLARVEALIGSALRQVAGLPTEPQVEPAAAGHDFKLYHLNSH